MRGINGIIWLVKQGKFCPYSQQQFPYLPAWSYGDCFLQNIFKKCFKMEKKLVVVCNSHNATKNVNFFNDNFIILAHSEIYRCGELQMLVYMTQNFSKIKLGRFLPIYKGVSLIKVV